MCFNLLVVLIIRLYNYTIIYFYVLYAYIFTYILHVWIFNYCVFCSGSCEMQDVLTVQHYTVICFDVSDAFLCSRKVVMTTMRYVLVIAVHQLCGNSALVYHWPRFLARRSGNGLHQQQFSHSGWLHGTVVERWSLSCARHTADGWPLVWVNRPL